MRLLLLLLSLLGAEIFDVEFIKVVSKVGLEEGFGRCTYTLDRGWEIGGEGGNVLGSAGLCLCLWR